MSVPKLCLIGEVIVDVTLTNTNRENKLRLGGIIHAARALWAIDVEYDLMYIAPHYLTQQVTQYASNIGANLVQQIGTVIGAPNVILVEDPTEAGPQGYELLLRSEYECHFNEQTISGALRNNDITDIVIFPGNYDLSKLLTSLQESTASIHIDIANGVDEIKVLEVLGRKFDTVILSTSSNLFLHTYSESLENICKDLVGRLCHTFLFKENRGGARLFGEQIQDKFIQVQAQVRNVVHSVGIGDCFDVVFLTLKHQLSLQGALTYASWIAAEYASTTYPEDFKDACKRVLSIHEEQIVSIEGVVLPWEKRQETNIYIAAPDFDFVDRTSIDHLVECLKYHNFKPRLPVRENGQMSANATANQKQILFTKDMELISECQLMVAVMIYDDPGTLIEIGLAAGLKIPVIVYDPYRKAHNLMLTQLPNLISANLDEIIAKVFVLAAR